MVDLSDDDGDENSNGEYWELLEPERLKSWSVIFAPMTDYLQFVMTFNNNTIDSPVSTINDTGSTFV